MGSMWSATIIRNRWRIFAKWWCLNFSGAGFFEANTAGSRCGTIWVCACRGVVTIPDWPG